MKEEREEEIERWKKEIKNQTKGQGRGEEDEQDLDQYYL